MSQILILTKNCLADIQLQQDLQKLSFEVFNSCSILDLLQADFDVSQLLRFFKIVILSESLSEPDVSLVMPHLKAYDIFIVRRDHEEPDEKQQALWTELGVDAWLVPTDSPTKMREKLLGPLYQRMSESGEVDLRSSGLQNRYLLNSFAKCAPDQGESILPGDFLRNLQENFSDQEQKIFYRLMERENNPLTREEICSMLWPEAEVEQKLAQISIIIRNMKAKFLEFGFEGKTLRTRRGVGYVLCQGFYHLLKNAAVEEERQTQANTLALKKTV